jgi:hypothetical protein
MEGDFHANPNTHSTLTRGNKTQHNDKSLPAAQGSVVGYEMLLGCIIQLTQVHFAIVLIRSCEWGSHERPKRSYTHKRIENPKPKT